MGRLVSRLDGRDPPSPRGRYHRGAVTGSPSQPPLPSRAWRAKVALAAALVAYLFVVLLYLQQSNRNVISDWDPTWAGARAWVEGRSPWAEITVPPWPNWLLYPMPAILLSAPFTFIP